jgi:hypothetical protein
MCYKHQRSSHHPCAREREGMRRRREASHPLTQTDPPITTIDTEREIRCPQHQDITSSSRPSRYSTSAVSGGVTGEGLDTERTVAISTPDRHSRERIEVIHLPPFFPASFFPASLPPAGAGAAFLHSTTWLDGSRFQSTTKSAPPTSPSHHTHV